MWSSTPVDDALVPVAPVVELGIRIVPDGIDGAAKEDVMDGVLSAASDETDAIAVGVAATVGTSIIGFLGGD